MRKAAKEKKRQRLLAERAAIKRGETLLLPECKSQGLQRLTERALATNRKALFDLEALQPEEELGDLQGPYRFQRRVYARHFLDLPIREMDRHLVPRRCEELALDYLQTWGGRFFVWKYWKAKMKRERARNLGSKI